MGTGTRRGGTARVSAVVVLGAQFLGAFARGGRQLLAPAPWPANGAHVAVNFYGPMPAFPYTKTSVLTNLIAPLQDSGLTVHTFVHSYFVSDEATSELLAALQPDAHSITGEDESLERFKYEIQGCARTQVNDAVHASNSIPRSVAEREVHDLFLRLVSLNRVNRLWRTAQEPYLFVIYARLDSHFICPFPTPWMFHHKSRMQVPTAGGLIYLPDFHLGPGLNDDFAVTDPQTANLMSDRLFYTIGTCGSQPAQAHSAMESFATALQLTVQLLPHFPFQRLSAGGVLLDSDLTGSKSQCLSLREASSDIEPVATVAAVHTVVR